MNLSSVSKIIIETLEVEASVIKNNLQRIEFIEEIRDVAKKLATAEHITVTGMGKSGLIAKKVTSTLTSTGTPSTFLHPADALHGDIGHLSKNEIVLAYSNSGETKEIIALLPHIKSLGGQLIAISGSAGSTLVKESDNSIVYQIEKEGCPLDLAPMASTTISLAIGDSIAAALIELKGFKTTDFGRFHPSGSLGKKLLTKVEDVLLPIKNICISKADSFHSIITKMVTTNLGAVLVLGSKGHLRGIITDGDIKRHLDMSYQDQKNQSFEKLWNKKAEDIMVKNPHCTQEGVLVEEALAIMHAKKTYILPILNKQKKPLGIIRMHDLIDFKSF